MDKDDLDSVCVNIYSFYRSSKNELYVVLLGDLMPSTQIKSSMFVDRNTGYNLCCNKQNRYGIF